MTEETIFNKTTRPAKRSFWRTWVLALVGGVMALAPQLVGALTIAGLNALIEVAPDGRIAGVIASGEQVIRYLGLGIAAYGLIIVIAYQWLANRYVVTPTDVSEIYGIIAKKKKTTKLAHIRRVGVHQTIIGRILGYGDVLYFSAGSGDVDVRVSDVRNPQAFADQVQKAIDGDIDPETGREKVKASVSEPDAEPTANDEVMPEPAPAPEPKPRTQPNPEPAPELEPEPSPESEHDAAPIASVHDAVEDVENPWAAGDRATVSEAAAKEPEETPKESLQGDATAGESGSGAQQGGRKCRRNRRRGKGGKGCRDGAYRMAGKCIGCHAPACSSEDGPHHTLL